MTAAEVWTDIPTWEGKYQVSSRGRVRSIARIVIDRRGRARRYHGKLLVLSKHTARGLDRVVTLSGSPGRKKVVFTPAAFLRKLARDDTAAGEATQ